MDTLLLEKVTNARGAMSLPGSKSISNRALLLAALSKGSTKIEGLLDSDDVSRMKESLTTLGINIESVNSDTFVIHGANGGFPVKKADLFLGNAGTAFRPLTAALALNQGEYTLKGIARMHERPIKDLVDALLALGLSIDYLENAGYPPLKIHASTINKQMVTVKGSVSSQFLTALLLALPMTKEEITINVEGELISKPYIEITLNLLKTFGINVINHDWKQFVIPANSYYQSPNKYCVEGDASSASYFLAMGAIAGNVTVKDVGNKSIQGDVRFVDALEKMGAIITWQDHAITVKAPSNGLSGIDLDCNHIPDAAMTLAIVALFAKGKTTLRNIGSWRVKETDRISAMATELTKLGVKVEEGIDYLIIYPPEKLNEKISIATYDDHRIAMCFSLCAFKVPIIIEEPHCVDKTFPTYFDCFKTLVS